MPSETHPQERVFMAFPPLGESFGTTGEAADEARHAWATVANVTVDFVPVTMLVNPPDLAYAKRLISRQVSTVEALLDDAWMRDIGPTFVVSKTEKLAAVTWQFNGWGQQAWAHWDKDRLIGHVVADLAGADAQRFGNRGHVDILDSIPTRVRFSFTVRKTPHTRTSTFTEAFDAVIADCETPDGKAWQVVDIPAPQRTRDQDGWTDYSHVNHLVTNAAAIACTFDDPNDVAALPQRSPRPTQAGRSSAWTPATRPATAAGSTASPSRSQWWGSGHER